MSLLRQLGHTQTWFGGLRRDLGRGPGEKLTLHWSERNQTDRGSVVLAGQRAEEARDGGPIFPNVLE